MPKEIIEKSANSELVVELIQLLEQEASLIETFLALLEEQQAALVQNDLEAINRVTNLQRKKAAEGGKLSRRRDELIGRISEIYDGTANISISRLINLVSSGQAHDLSRIKDTILDLSEKVNKVKTQNELLINQSRENIKATMELLGRIKTPQTQYQKEGRTDGPTASVALDRRA